MGDPDHRREAFRELVKAYERPLYIVIRKMVLDHDETKDVLQETFIKVWENLDRFQSKSDLYTWVYRIAVNHCLAHLKKKKRIRLFGRDDWPQAQISSEDTMGGDEMEKKLQEAILKLPDKQRMIFNLKYFEEMSYDQMARITDTSSGALRASYHHAVKKIEEYIQR